MIHNLKDYSVGVTDQEIIGSTSGSSGSWWEPAEAPEYEYEITGIEIDEWSTYDDRPDIKVGDTIDVQIDFELPNAINAIYTGAMAVEKVEYSKECDCLFLTVSGNSGIEYGNTPAQSFRGRE